MRAEKNNPRQIYADFWDWLLMEQHCLWLLNALLAYMYYLATTEEI